MQCNLSNFNLIFNKLQNIRFIVQVIQNDEDDYEYPYTVAEVKADIARKENLEGSIQSKIIVAYKSNEKQRKQGCSSLFSFLETMPLQSRLILLRMAYCTNSN